MLKKVRLTCGAYDWGTHPRTNTEVNKKRIFFEFVNSGKNNESYYVGEGIKA